MTEENHSPYAAGMPPATLPAALQKPRLRRQEASVYLLSKWGITVAPTTLAKYATVGGGPGYQKLGATPLYRREDLDAWAQKKLGNVVHSSSEWKHGQGAR